VPQQFVLTSISTNNPPTINQSYSWLWCHSFWFGESRRDSSEINGYNLSAAKWKQL